MITFALSLFFSDPLPLDMPRAESYLVSENGIYKLEDRYVRMDIWVSRSVIGRWMDDDGRIFTLSRLDSIPPPIDAYGTDTRVGYGKSHADVDLDDMKQLRRCVGCLSPVEPAAEPSLPRHLIRGYDDVRYWHGTNENAVVCSFLPQDGNWRYMAVWELVDGDVIDDAIVMFENRFLRAEVSSHPDAVRVLEWKRKGFRDEKRRRRPSVGDSLCERELLRKDARHSVAAYGSWRVTDAPEFTVLDEIGGNDGFIVTLTNDFSCMRELYAEVMPSKVSVSNVLSVARVYASRDEYLDAVGMDMSWTAAYWSPLRREIVAYLPPEGADRLLKTFRHEAFHQYMSYAASMYMTSPWINEGYAQYFEDVENSSWGEEFVLTPGIIDGLAEFLPALFVMDYGEFYSGDAFERRMKYRLAWSVARFIEHGAGKVRFDPFKNLKQDYMSAIVDMRGDMRAATAKAFGSDEKQKLFVEEWAKFWKNPSR